MKCVKMYEWMAKMPPDEAAKVLDTLALRKPAKTKEYHIAIRQICKFHTSRNSVSKKLQSSVEKACNLLYAPIMSYLHNNGIVKTIAEFHTEYDTKKMETLILADSTAKFGTASNDELRVLVAKYGCTSAMPTRFQDECVKNYNTSHKANIKTFDELLVAFGYMQT